MTHENVTITNCLKYWTFQPEHTMSYKLNIIHSGNLHKFFSKFCGNFFGILSTCSYDVFHVHNSFYYKKKKENKIVEFYWLYLWALNPLLNIKLGCFFSPLLPEGVKKTFLNKNISNIGLGLRRNVLTFVNISDLWINNSKNPCNIVTYL